MQQGFTEDRAKRVAKTFKSSLEYVPDEVALNTGGDDSGKPGESHEPKGDSPPNAKTKERVSGFIAPDHIEGVLARYSIPLGENEATIVFTGKSLSPEDFDALIEYVQLFKRQFQRRQTKEQAPAPDGL